MTARLVRLVRVVGTVAGTSTLVVGLGLATPAARAASLREDTSPYLVRCAVDPIAWRPWGDAAFVEARTTRRPVLVSLGDSFSFDTHERDRRQLADPEMVRLVNRRFVAVKVDRKQRPEIETVYRLLSGRAEESEISTRSSPRMGVRSVSSVSTRNARRT
jgi:hypothetical protein